VKDESLVKLSILTSIIGISGLLVFLFVSKPLQVRVQDIDETLLGKRVEVSGKVEDLFSKNGHIFFYLRNVSKIKVVAFRSTVKRLGLEDLRDGDSVKVIGTVERYRGEIEIITKDLRILS